MMKDYEQNEQWKHGGDCSKCRRKNYCGNICTLKKRVNKAILRQLVKNIMNEMTGGVMQESIDKTIDGLY